MTKEEKRISMGNPNMSLVGGLWHRYTAEEINSVIAMSEALYKICPAPDKEHDIKHCPMNCPFRPYKEPGSEYQQVVGCQISQALLGDKWRLQRWVDRQESEDKRDWQTVERDD